MLLARQLLLCLFLVCATTAPSAGAETKALLLSDIHFEPFADPGKVPALAAAPAAKWDAILSSPPSPDRDQRFAALQSACKTRGLDTSYTLLQSSLNAMRSTATGIAFITVSGDLNAHAFACKYTQLFPNAKPGDYEAFVAKTLQYVVIALRATFPKTPIYAALGNNDTGCGDYQLDARSPFLNAAGKAILEGLPQSQQRAALATFALGGYYTALFPGPAKTRLIVLNHLFMSSKYTTCGGAPDDAEIDEQLGWAREQLTAARRNHEKVWIMGHIPPGVNIYSTAAKMTNLCNGKGPVMFLSSEHLENLLSEFDDVITLGLFGHTHMDELRLVKTTKGGVPIKLVPSISPIDGNDPSFTVATIAEGVLRNYEVQTQRNGAWQKDYDYTTTYHQNAFTAPAVTTLIANFEADPGAKKQESQDYIKYFFPGDRTDEIAMFWPEYTCALSNLSAKTFTQCMCNH